MIEIEEVSVHSIGLFIVAAVGVGLVLVSVPALAGGPSETEVAKGKTAYNQLCAQCHGPNMINAGVASFDLRKFPGNEFNRFKTSVTEGRGDMPAWGDMLIPGELESLWAYVRSGNEK